MELLKKDKRTQRSRKYKKKQKKEKINKVESLEKKQQDKEERKKENKKKNRVKETKFFLILLKRYIHYLALLCYILILIYISVCIPIIYGYKPLVVLSGSMEPTYKIGSIIYYKKVLENEIQVNDVVTFSLESDTFITHRIIENKDGYYLTKGDANTSPDVRKINYENIHGKVANTSIPLIGYYIEFVNNHLYIVLCIIIILVSEFLLGSVKTFDIDKSKERK